MHIMSEELLGKKLYFVNAPAVFKEYIDELWNYEIEAYAVAEFSALMPILLADNSALVFFNFEGDKQSLEKLKRNIEMLRSEDSCRHIEIGLFSVRDLRSQFSEISQTLQIECGYFIITDKQRVLQTILQICAQKAVKGRRKYIRVKCPLNYASFNCECRGMQYRGHILDISLAGMAVLFEGSNVLPLNVKVDDIQCNLHGIIVSVDGITFKTYQSEENTEQPITVILFDPKSLDKMKEAKVHVFIRQKLQKDLETALFSYQNT